MKAFPFFQQPDMMDCGPTCLRMICAYYGKQHSLSYLRSISHVDREGVSFKGIAVAAEQLGMMTVAVKMPYEHKDDEYASILNVPLPCIVHWEQNHFIVVYKANRKHVWVADPVIGKVKLTRAKFEEGWCKGATEGLALLFEPTPDFYKEIGEEPDRSSFGFLLNYLKPYRRLIVQLILGLLLGSVFQLIFPFLTQSLVDVGIQNQDINFVYLILAAQLMLFLSQLMVEFIQSWILLHIGTRVNVTLISDFLRKLLKLPIGFFDTKMMGDLLQRIDDHQRIEAFLTSTTLRTLFSAVNIIIFGIVLLIYNKLIFLVFFLASSLYLAWIFIFLKRRRLVDHQRFKEAADNQSTLIELIEGAQEIKLQGSQQKRRWKWAGIQARLFRTSIRSLSITQYQDAGANFINQLKNILISFIAAKAVIDGQMTLGMMLAVQYIVGQLNAPLLQLVNFIRTAQDAKIGMERLNEIHLQEEEEPEDIQKVINLPENLDINIKDVYFKYNELNNWVLENINLHIPQGKTTAIVGKSGSGKTTLVKLLLGFYQPTTGHIRVGGISLQNIKNELWRSQCGAVMQDGYIFSDTIANNIAESSDQIDAIHLMNAIFAANIQDFIEDLPLGYNTIIGAKGNSISQGQKQRLLIARTVYKNPTFIFFDEATNALDAENEKIIMENMNSFFQGRTVIVVAHRLSTVKHADQIVVIDKGSITEVGTHKSLLAKKGDYYQLVKNQLEL